MCNVPEGTVTAEAAGSSPSRKSLTINSCFVVYYRPIFLISFLQEVFLRSVILFQSDFCFIRKYLRFRLRSFEFRRCPIFALAAMTGLRPGEVLGLSIDDLDFEQRSIFVRRSAWY